ncbi:hypothetical protein JCM10908_006667 [Rhodotorula pacifica]|uniref:uncharacterized protein n=1 Tax=Rhodotorula pacifica TaxID=1495444 RepID=UPI003177229F
MRTVTLAQLADLVRIRTHWEEGHPILGSAVKVGVKDEGACQVLRLLVAKQLDFGDSSKHCPGIEGEDSRVSPIEAHTLTKVRTSAAAGTEAGAAATAEEDKRDLKASFSLIGRTLNPLESPASSAVMHGTKGAR